MVKVNIKARIRRNKFDVLAENSYRDENSEIVKYLNSVNKKALVGIQREDGIYTIVGEEFIYYLTALGKEGEIRHKDLLEILTKNARSLGKMGHFEFVNINEQDAVWLKNIETMNAMWNTIMLLDDANNSSKSKTE